jgi:alditol oxidase
MAEQNWARTYTYRAGVIHTPTSEDELRNLVSGAERVHVLGSRHSFNGIADSAELVSLDALPGGLRFDESAGTVSFNGAWRYGHLAEALNEAGVALRNMASLPHISVAGAVATATHGSGYRNGNLATAVAGLELLKSDGNFLRVSRGDPDFDGMVVGLGALGVVTRLTLDVEPAYEVRQFVFEDLAWDVLLENLDAVTGAGHSVSLFTRWTGPIEQVWIKRRVDRDEPPLGDRFFGARAAVAHRHPIVSAPAENCTPQLGIPGRWSDRLPHFRMGFMPSSGEEIQSEFFVPFRHAVGALRAIRNLGERIEPELQVTELRTVAADELWMSPQYRQDTLAIHFTWKRNPIPVGGLVRSIESALAPFEGRPHWGKVSFAEAATIARRYERLDDFVALTERLDPRRAFRNEWLERTILGGNRC